MMQDLFESFLLERCHYVSLWAIYSFIPTKMPSQKVLLSQKSRKSHVSVGLPFWSWGTPCMFFMLCNRCHFGQSCGCCHATSRETKVNKPWKRGLTNPGPEQVTTYLVPNWKTVIMRQVMFILYRSHMRKKNIHQKEWRWWRVFETDTSRIPSAMSGSLAGFRSSKSTNAEEIQVHDGCSCAWVWCCWGFLSGSYMKQNMDIDKLLNTSTIFQT